MNRTSDLALLSRILQPGNDPELSPYEKAAFTGMQQDLQSGQVALTLRQRAFATEVEKRLQPFDTSKVPRGREVITPAVLRQPLPKRPPGR